MCYATTGPLKSGPLDHLRQLQLVPPGPFAALQMFPPDQLWRCGWSPFATAGPPYNTAFITFYRIIATLKIELLC